jgi:hypothetical protein
LRAQAARPPRSFGVLPIGRPLIVPADEGDAALAALTGLLAVEERF